MSTSQCVIVMAMLIVMSAYFSATETAFSSLNKTRLKAMAEKGSKKAALALRLSETYDKLISTILVGNNIVNIAMASIGTMLFVRLYGDVGATVSTAVVTVAVLIFGEISPKSIAKDCPERFAMFSAPLIRLLITLLTPVNFLFTQWKKLLTRLLHVENDTKMSQEELLMLVEEGEQEGTIDTDEGDLIRNVIEFTDQKAGDILTHRVDLEAVNITDSKEKIARVFFETQFSRLPVYEESIDRIIGIIHLKDFFTPQGITEQPLESIMTQPLLIQKSVKIDDLLKLLQKNKTHLAVVVDEYGGTLGIVTMEDIFEELVGEIWDEHDEVVEEFSQIDDRTCQVDGMMAFEDFCEMFQITAETERSSVGGWVMEQLGKIPEVGDGFDFPPVHITVCETDGKRAARITVERRQDMPSPADSDRRVPS